MNHKGLRQYTGDEASNLSMSMLGWDMHSNTSETATQKTLPSGVEYWVAIKILSDNVELQAQSHPDFGGDDFSNTGEYSSGVDRRIKCTHGDVIYGCFTEVSVAEIAVANATAVVQLIRGK
tara:strand:- start:2427 stop:2789 length:363 start_codon:yes stop_codon:yes gene_type:complete